MTPADRVRLSVINRAGQEIDEYFTQHPGEFAHNPEGKLKDYIREMGGIEALATQLRVSIERERSRKRREEPETDTAKQMQNALAKRASPASQHRLVPHYEQAPQEQGKSTCLWGTSDTAGDR